jgi:small nuclear ribonucleoprotein (snRNP)-like protein
MEGLEVIVELKNGKRLRGTLVAADNEMNLTLHLTEEENNDEGDILVATNHIRGSNIRYIHFPDNADLKGTVSSGMERERAAANKYKRGKRK